MLDSLNVRNDWTRSEADAIYNQPFNDLLFQAQTVHRQHFDLNQIQRSKLISINTGGCVEVVPIAASRADMSDEMQAMRFLAKANSIFVGDALLTAGNPEEDNDAALFSRLGITAMAAGCDGAR